MVRRWWHIAEVARKQFGLATTEQLLAAGFSKDAVKRAVRSGRLHRVHIGVYAVGYRSGDERARLLAAVLACGPDGMTSHCSAGGLMSMLHQRSGLVDVTVIGQGGRDRSSVRIHRPRSMEPDEYGTFNLIPCTSPSRTIIDIAAEGHGWQTRKAIEQAEGLGLLEVEGIETLYERYPRRAGSVGVRKLLGTYEPVPAFTRSGLERRTFRLCTRAGIELPAMNVPIATEFRTYEADCVWAAERLIIECDSRRWHDNPVAAERDALKDQALTDAGWRVHRLRWLQIVRAPERAARTIENLLAQQRRLFALGVS